MIFLDFIQTIVLALSLFVVIYLFLLQPHQVKGLSMLPNFHDKELLLTDKISYRFNLPQRGEVVIFKAPPGEPCAEIECEYIKRVIALPGEKVMIANQNIYVNGGKLEESYLPSNFVSNKGSFLTEGVEQIIPEGNYLLLGDNRSQSRDGREFGPIDKLNIVGKAWLRYWPLANFGVIKRPFYPKD